MEWIYKQINFSDTDWKTFDEVQLILDAIEDPQLTEATMDVWWFLYKNNIATDSKPYEYLRNVIDRQSNYSIDLKMALNNFKQAITKFHNTRRYEPFIQVLDAIDADTLSISGHAKILNMFIAAPDILIIDDVFDEAIDELETMVEGDKPVTSSKINKVYTGIMRMLKKHKQRDEEEWAERQERYEKEFEDMDKEWKKRRGYDPDKRRYKGADTSRKAQREWQRRHEEWKRQNPEMAQETEFTEEETPESRQAKREQMAKKTDFKPFCDKKLMCENKIYNKKDFNKWLIKNHPDKCGAKYTTPEEIEECKKKREIVWNRDKAFMQKCVDMEFFCT